MTRYGTTGAGRQGRAPQHDPADADGRVIGLVPGPNVSRAGGRRCWRQQEARYETPADEYGKRVGNRAPDAEELKPQFGFFIDHVFSHRLFQNLTKKKSLQATEGTEESEGYVLAPVITKVEMVQTVFKRRVFSVPSVPSVANRFSLLLSAAPIV